MIGKKGETTVVDGEGEAVLLAVAADLVQVELVVLVARQFALQAELEQGIGTAKRAQAGQDALGWGGTGLRPEIGGFDDKTAQAQRIDGDMLAPAQAVRGNTEKDESGGLQVIAFIVAGEIDMLGGAGDDEFPLTETAMLEAMGMADQNIAKSMQVFDVALVSQSNIENLHAFRYVLVGHSHRFEHRRLGKRELIIAGATQHIDFARDDESDDLQAPGFVFLGIAPDGLRWCKHIAVDSLRLRRLVIEAPDLWAQPGTTPTEGILDRLRPLGSPDTLLQLCLQGELTRHQYHQLDLNQIRRYGEQYCFALAIDDSRLSLLPDHTDALGAPLRLSPRQELLSLIEEEIAASRDEQEKRALQITKEELLIALDEVKGRSL